MCIIIIYKWTIAWGDEKSTAEAPSLIGQMIALPLKMGSTEGKPLWDMQAQESLQYNLLILALICVPWMLIFKPIIIWARMPSSPAHEKRDVEDSLNEHLEDEDRSPVKHAGKEAEKAKGGHGGHD